MMVREPAEENRGVVDEKLMSSLDVAAGRLEGPPRDEWVINFATNGEVVARGQSLRVVKGLDWRIC